MKRIKQSIPLVIFTFFWTATVVALIIYSQSFRPGEVLAENTRRAREVLNRSKRYDLENLVVVYRDNPNKLVLVQAGDGSNGADPPTEAGSIQSSRFKAQKVLPEEDVEFEVKRAVLETKYAELLLDSNVLHVQPNFMYETLIWTRSGDADYPGDFDMNTGSPGTGNHWYYELAKVRQMWQDQDCEQGGGDCGGSSGAIVAVIDTGLAYEDRVSAWGDDFDVNTDMFVTGPTDGITLYHNTDEVYDGTDTDGNGVRDDKYGFNASDYEYCKPPPGEENDPPCTPAKWAEEGRAYDDNGHGTFVTGLIASLVDNAFASVSPAHNVSIMPVKASDFHSPVFYTIEVVSAIDYAMNNGADVINMSFGGPDFDQSVSDKLDEARSAGVVLVAASGNDGSGVSYPAKYSSTIAVGAANFNGSRSSYSNYGPELDVVAYVGENLVKGGAAYQRSYDCFFNQPSSDCSTAAGEDFTTFSTYYSAGTSFAAPQVAALAGMLRAIAPALPVSDIENYIYNNADDLGATGKDNATGYGAIDYEATYLAVAVNSAPTITVVEPDGVGDTADESFTITWTDTDPDNDATVNFYYDADGSGEDGTLINECSGISEDDATDSCDFDTHLVPNGSYYIYGCITDYINSTVCDYSSGTVDISNSTLRDWGKATVSIAYKQVNFSTSFNIPPVVIAQVTSESAPDKLYVNVKDVTTTGFKVIIEENQVAGYDGVHLPEIVSWYAVQNATNEEQLGSIGVTDQWVTVTFLTPFGSAPHVFAMPQVQNGGDLDYADIKGVTPTGFLLRVEEPAGYDGTHIEETVGWVAFEDNSDAQEGKATTDESWSKVTYPSGFPEPPVLIAMINTEAGGAQVNVDITQTWAISYRFRMEEDPKKNDGIHFDETISWAAFPYVHPNVQEGTAVIEDGWTQVMFDEPFWGNPMLVVENNTEWGGNTVEVDLKWITRQGFMAKMEEDKKAGWDGVHVDEKISFYGVHHNDSDHQIGSVSADRNWKTVNFSPAFSTKPKLFANIQTENGGDTAMVDIRWLGPASFQIRVEEDWRAGWDGNHVFETIGWIAFENAPIGQVGTGSIGSSWATVTFSPTPFATVPKLLAEINSDVNTETSQADIRNLTPSGFDMRVEEEPNRYDGFHPPESVVWFAWE